MFPGKKSFPFHVHSIIPSSKYGIFGLPSVLHGFKKKLHNMIGIQQHETARSW